MRYLKSMIASMCFILLFASFAAADPIWYDQNPAVKPGIPDIGWVSTNTLLTSGSGYCGYVAAANILFYWNSNGYPNLITDETSYDALMTDLIGSLTPGDSTYHRYLYQTGTIPGTSSSELETGLENYFTDKGYSMIIQQYSPPNTLQSLIESELKACEQVIVGTETHWLTATGWWYNESTMETWLGFHDPNDLQTYGVNFGGSEDYYQTSTASGLSLLYGSWTIVDSVIKISPIPEPTAILLFGTGLCILWLGTNKRIRK